MLGGGVQYGLGRCVQGCQQVRERLVLCGRTEQVQGQRVSFHVVGQLPGRGALCLSGRLAPRRQQAEAGGLAQRRYLQGRGDGAVPQAPGGQQGPAVGMGGTQPRYLASSESAGHAVHHPQERAVQGAERVGDCALEGRGAVRLLAADVELPSDRPQLLLERGQCPADDVGASGSAVHGQPVHPGRERRPEAQCVLPGQQGLPDPGRSVQLRGRGRGGPRHQGRREAVECAVDMPQL